MRKAEVFQCGLFVYLVMWVVFVVLVISNLFVLHRERYEFLKEGYRPDCFT
jgi:hypothetical protein